MKTAAALRASDTAFLHQDSMGKINPEWEKASHDVVFSGSKEVNVGPPPRCNPSPVQEAALRAALGIINSTVNPAMRHDAVNCNSRNLASIIASEFDFVDELIDCLSHLYSDYQWQSNSTSDNHYKVRALLERIEKGTK